DVVGKVMIVRISSKRQIGNDRAEVQHCCQLNAQLAGRVNSNTELKRITYTCGLYAWTDASPKRCIKENHVNSSVQNVRCKLFETNHHSISGKGNADLFAGPSH